MATSTISNTIKNAINTPIADVKVVIRLMPCVGFKITDDVEIAQRYDTVTDSNGLWTATLEQNINITPAGTYYEVEEKIPLANGGGKKWIIQVGISNQTVKAALVSVVPSITTSNYLTQAAADARYVQSPGSFAAGAGESRPGDAQTAGVLTTYSRGDHVHDRERISGTNADRLALAGTDLFSGLVFTATDTNRQWLYEGSTWYLLPSANTPRVRAVRTTTQSLTSATITAISLTGTDVYDTDSMHDPASNASRVTLPFIGLWRVSFTCRISIPAAATQVAAWVAINSAGAGSGIRYGNVENLTPATAHTWTGSGSFDLPITAITDYIELIAYQASGSARDALDDAVGGLVLAASYVGPIF